MSLDFDSLQDIAQAMTIKGKGILAADESNPTCKKRFDSIDVDSTEKRAWKSLLVVLFSLMRP